MQDKKQNWFSKFFKKKKPIPKDSIKIYAIYHCTQEEYRKYSENMIPIYYAKSKEDALEAVARLIYQKNYTHFCLWLDLHTEELKAAGIDPKDKNNSHYRSKAWELYLDARFSEDKPVDDSNLYTVVAIYYSSSEVASFLRVLAVSQPLGMDGEKGEEIANFNLLYHAAPTVKYKNVEVIKSFIPFMESDPAFEEKVLQYSDTVSSIFKDALNAEKKEGK